MRHNKNKKRALTAVAMVVTVAILILFAHLSERTVAQNLPPEISLDSAAAFPVDI